MPAMWDKKKAMSDILQRRRMAGGGEVLSGPTPMKSEHVMTEGGQPDMKHMAAEEVMHAFHSKSAHQLRKSLENFIDLHMNHEKDNDEPSPNDG